MQIATLLLRGSASNSLSTIFAISLQSPLSFHSFSVVPISMKRAGLESAVGPWCVASIVISNLSKSALLSQRLLMYDFWRYGWGTATWRASPELGVAKVSRAVARQRKRAALGGVLGQEYIAVIVVFFLKPVGRDCRRWNYKQVKFPAAVEPVPSLPHPPDDLRGHVKPRRVGLVCDKKLHEIGGGRGCFKIYYGTLIPPP